jgi:hypothetical protein
MALAKYIVHVPQQDPQGNPLRDLASAAHESLYRNTGRGVEIADTKIHRNVEGQEGPHDEIVAYVEASPEADSTFKQLGVHLAELAGVPAITVIREGKDGQVWPMSHPLTTGFTQADSAALSPPSASDSPVGITSALRRLRT